MAQINIRDTTHKRLNSLVKKEIPPTPYVRITQDYIINKALDKLEGLKA